MKHILVAALLLCAWPAYADDTPPSSVVCDAAGNCEAEDSQSEEPIDPVMCTMDAKLCPDGSYVSRQGPNCEFAPCPEDTENSHSK